jgi:hypothetical protein
MFDPTIDSTPAEDYASSEQVARAIEEESSQAETRAELDSLEGTVTHPRSLQELFTFLSTKLRELIASIKNPFKSNQASSQPSSRPQATPATLQRTLTFETEGTRRNRLIPYNLKQRNGNKCFTGGMLGRLFGDERVHEGGDSNFDLNHPRALSQIRYLIETCGVQNIVTLSGGGSYDAITKKLAELGYTQVNVCQVRLSRADNLEEARERWQSNSFLNAVRMGYAAFRRGCSYIHCHNGMHRSVTFALICFMLDNPNLSYQQALDLNVSPSEQLDSNFLAYAPLAQALGNNPTLRAQILNG